MDDDVTLKCSFRLLLHAVLDLLRMQAWQCRDATEQLSGVEGMHYGTVLTGNTNGQTRPASVIAQKATMAQVLYES